MGNNYLTELPLNIKGCIKYVFPLSSLRDFNIKRNGFGISHSNVMIELIYNDEGNRTNLAKKFAK